MTDDSGTYVIEASRRILEELDDRTEGDLSLRDHRAVSTAISKALIAGFRQGSAAQVFAARQQGVKLISHVSVEEVDLWAERYSQAGPLARSRRAPARTSRSPPTNKEVSGPSRSTGQASAAHRRQPKQATNRPAGAPPEGNPRPAPGPDTSATAGASSSGRLQLNTDPRS